MQRTSPIGEVLLTFSEIDSTNNYAMQLLNEGMAEHGMVIQADFQTKGRGQHGNVWQAEESKNLLCSVIYDTTPLALSQQFLLNMYACVSVCQCLREYAGLTTLQVKWPNDLFISGKKIAGILMENTLRGSLWMHAIVGIGINVNQDHFADLNRATSLKLESGQVFKIPGLLHKLIKYLNRYYTLFLKQPDEIHRLYNEALWLRDTQVSFVRHQEWLSGRLAGVDKEGQLLIETEGRIKAYRHKEIELITD